ncbi:MAG: hypothetical protein B6I24_10760 [Bacteroidetes bacterium 4572_128]|nr:MAG: hypothetical protein B6I24_10760 [Bacteroidetes bacterium 4572_128]
MVFEKISCENIAFKFPEMKLKKNDVFFEKKILLEIHINEEMKKDTLIEIFAKNENIKNNLFEIVFDEKENKLSNLQTQ